MRAFVARLAFRRGSRCEQILVSLRYSSFCVALSLSLFAQSDLRFQHGGAGAALGDPHAPVVRNPIRKVDKEHRTQPRQLGRSVMRQEPVA